MNHKSIPTLTDRDMSLINKLEELHDLGALFDDERAVIVKLLALYDADEILNSSIASSINFDSPAHVIKFFSKPYLYMSGQSILEELFDTDIVKYGLDHFLNRLDKAILPEDLTPASVYSIFNV